MARILVTSAHSRIGYQIVRNLGAHGHQLVCAGRHVPSMCSGLQNVIADRPYGDPFENPSKFIDSICDLVREFRIDVILPAHEEIFVLAKYADELGNCKLASPSYDALLQIHDKYNVSCMAQALKVPSPVTIRLSNPESLLEAASRLSFPFIVKPRWGSGAAGVKQIKDEQSLNELKDNFETLLTDTSYIAQQKVSGVGAGVGVLLDHGRAIAVGGHERLREIPITGGTSTARKTLQDEKLKAAAITLAQGSKLHTGVCMVEFKTNHETGEFWVIEVNPRYWGGMATALEAGINFPSLHMNALMNGDSQSMHSPEAVKLVESRWFLGEVRYIFEALSHQKWKDVLSMVRVQPGHHMKYEDIGPGRWHVFRKQLAAYIHSYQCNGNFGFQNASKTAFFNQAYQSA